jgi:predicted O-methyltransferase YrrM
MRVDVPMKLMELAGGDRFVDVRGESEEHQRAHRCGLHHAGAPPMQLVAALAQTAGVVRALDLGSGLGYSTLWIASAVAEGGSVIGVDDDPLHTGRATEILAGREVGVRVEYVTGAVREVLPSLEGPFDMIHDDAWFAKTPDHLDAMLAQLRPGGLLTMANWFLLVDAITGETRNDWESFAGPDWAKDTIEYAQLLAARPDLDVTWVTAPPIAFATAHSGTRGQRIHGAARSVIDSVSAIWRNGPNDTLCTPIARRSSREPAVEPLTGCAMTLIGPVSSSSSVRTASASGALTG